MGRRSSAMYWNCHRVLLPGGFAMLLCLAARADVLFSTGHPRRCLFNGFENYVGFSSGELPQSAAPVRWIAQPVSLAPGLHTITEVRAVGFVPIAFEFETLRFRLFSRTGTAPPTLADEIATGSHTMVGGYSGEMIELDPNTIAPWQFRIPNQNVTIPGGDYYIVVHADDPLETNGQCSFQWFVNAPGGIALVDAGPPDDPSPGANDYGWLWRSDDWPTPGFSPYQTAYSTFHSAVGADNSHLYVASFEIIGTTGGGGGCPLPGCDTGGVDADFNGNCEVNLSDLAVLLANFGTVTGATHAMGNTNPAGDTDVDLADLSITLARFGTICHP